MRRLSNISKRVKFIGTAAIVFLCAAVFCQIVIIKKSAEDTLAAARTRLLMENRVPFEKKFLTPHLTKHISILQTIAGTRDFVRFRDSYFAATGGGLAQYSEDGNLMRHFTVLDGLPESDLTALVVWRERLYIGTRTKNLLEFDGEKFAQFVWTDRTAQAVNAFLVKDGKLLIGTFAGGLIEFDGTIFTELKADGKRIEKITCLAANDSKIYAGTFDNGLWSLENGVSAHFTTVENLPSNRVVGIAFKDGRAFLATDFGLAAGQENSFHSLAVLPSLSGLIVFQNRLFLTRDDGTIYTFENALKIFADGGDHQNSLFTVTDDSLYFLSNQGVFKVADNRLKAFSNEIDARQPTDNFVSALATDRSGNLWIGTFRRGIDVFSADGRLMRHIETENVREINFLQPSAGDGEIRAATSAGLHTIAEKTFSLSEGVQTKKTGLTSNSVLHFSGAYTATAKGLAFSQNGKLRALSTVSGLPNNAVYATLESGGKLYAGTLGGLAEIESNRVARVFKDSNSNLKTNWVTALIETGERIFIGTYGGGVFELLPSGEIRSFETETGKFAVNPNAFYADDERLYAGTLTGVKTLDLKSGRWTHVRGILPAEIVMSVAGDAENVYFGTTAGVARVAKKYFETGETEQ